MHTVLVNQLGVLNLFSSCFYTTCEGQLSLEANKRYYTVSTKHESDYRAAHISEKTLQTFEISQKHIYIHNSAHMHIASVKGLDKLRTFTSFWQQYQSYFQ